MLYKVTVASEQGLAVLLPARADIFVWPPLQLLSQLKQTVKYKLCNYAEISMFVTYFYVCLYGEFED